MFVKSLKRVLVLFLLITMVIGVLAIIAGPVVAAEEDAVVAMAPADDKPASDEPADGEEEEAAVPETELPAPKVVEPEVAAETAKKLIWFAVTFLSGFVILIGIIVLITLGLKMMTASSPEKAQAAKAQFARVLIGLALVALAGVLVSTVVYIVTKPLS